MDQKQALRIIESLRLGIPPDGFVRQFTVGREDEINDLVERLQKEDGTALLINANYGSGKTHLLRYISEVALKLNYVVSNVTIDSKSAVRFNRMDQVFGSVCRNIRVPQFMPKSGLRTFFNALIDPSNDDNAFWDELSNHRKWDYSEVLDSPAMFIALRAWVFGDREKHDFIEDWFYQPDAYRSQRKKLYVTLIASLRNYFREPRPDWKFYKDNLLQFHTQGYQQCWAALRDIHNLAQIFGFKGLIILFDEFEDVITNLNNIKHQESAFWNLFEFYIGKKFPGKTFYAVTPGFVKKCKQRLLDKDRWDFDFSRFENLPKYEMSPLQVKHLEDLAIEILTAHSVAYNWEPDLIMKQSQLKKVVEEAAQIQVQDRARHVIKTVVAELDDLLGE